MKALLAIAGLVVLLAAGAWFTISRVTPPVIEIRQPSAQVGQTISVDVAVTAPGGALDRLEIGLEQAGKTFPVFSLGSSDPTLFTQEAADRVKVARKLTRKDLPELKSGPAKLVVTTERRGPFGLGKAAVQSSRDLTVRLEPPRVAVLSLHHFINHGGSEMVVYRATPAGVASGVRVDTIDYPGYPAADAGVPGADPALRVAFFALLHDQDLNTPIQVFARDDAGNEATADFEHRVFPKPFRKSNIPIEDRFLQRVVPAILGHTPDLKVNDPENLVESFLTINGDLRRQNAEFIAGLARKSAPKILWDGPFRQLTNSQVESAFADQRTYVYQGREIDRQVHLGFDLAVTTNVPVKSANRGVVAYADYLGIYGNCVIVDHGMGVQSLYAHLSSFDVGVGDTVQKEQVLGRSGMTGLAGGDHLHFTMLVHGHPVTPVDWWSQQWVEDRILRKLREAGAAAPATTATR